MPRKTSPFALTEGKRIDAASIKIGDYVRITTQEKDAQRTMTGEVTYIRHTGLGLFFLTRDGVVLGRWARGSSFSAILLKHAPKFDDTPIESFEDLKRFAEGLRRDGETPTF